MMRKQRTKPAGVSEWSAIDIRKTEYLRFNQQDYLCITFLTDNFDIPKWTRSIRLLLFKRKVRNSYEIYLRAEGMVYGYRCFRWSWGGTGLGDQVFPIMSLDIGLRVGYLISADSWKKFYIRIECSDEEVKQDARR